MTDCEHNFLREQCIYCGLTRFEAATEAAEVQRLERLVRKRIRKNPERASKCEVCGAIEPLTHHHLTPKAEGGKDRARNLVTLCKGCHSLTHEVYGPGDDYTGPREREPFLAARREFYSRVFCCDK